MQAGTCPPAGEPPCESGRRLRIAGLRIGRSIPNALGPQLDGSLLSPRLTYCDARLKAGEPAPAVLSIAPNGEPLAIGTTDGCRSIPECHASLSDSARQCHTSRSKIAPPFGRCAHVRGLSSVPSGLSRCPPLMRQTSRAVTLAVSRHRPPSEENPGPLVRGPERYGRSSPVRSGPTA
jgi:hypothetical protein